MVFTYGWDRENVAVPPGSTIVEIDLRSGALVVKLDEGRVTELLARGEAEPFAPKGRRVREWATIPADAHERWEALLDDALAASAARRTI